MILTFTYVNETVRNEGEDNRRTVKIIVANRVSLFDVIALRTIIASNKCKVVCEKNFFVFKLK